MRLHPHRRMLGMAAMALTVGACHLLAGLDGVDEVTAAAGQGGSGAAGPGGMGCTDCGPDDACGTYSCNGGTCDAEYAAVDTLCATGACDGAGMCVPLPDGASCGGDDALCDSGFCVDGLCCAEACDGECEACNGAIPGTCEPVAAGDDPAMECVPGGGSILGGGVCDGARQCAGGGAVWARAYSDSGDQRVRAVRYDSAGNLVVLGTFNGTVDFGGGEVASDGSNDDLFVVKYDSSGNHIWETILSTPGGDIAIARVMGLDGSDNVVIAGHFVGEMTVDGTDYPSGGSDGTDAIVVKLDASTGTPAIPTILGGPGQQYIQGIHVDGTGAVTLLGEFINGDWVVDTPTPTTLTNPSGNFDVALIFLDAALSPIAARSFGDDALQRARDLAVDSAGNIIFAGYFDGTITLPAPVNSITSTGSMPL